MQTPKTMAIKVNKKNIDIVAAVIPGFVALDGPNKQHYGKYLVINNPIYVACPNDGFEGIALHHELMPADEFKRRFKAKEQSLSGEFFPVRQKKPKIRRVKRGATIYRGPHGRARRY